MNYNLRACLAFVAASLVSQSSKSAIFDHAQGKHIHVSGNISFTDLNIFDHDRGQHISGSLPNLFDHGLGSHVSLNMDGTQFKGFDHGSGSHYSGQVTGNNVQIFDHATGQHYQYSV